MNLSHENPLYVALKLFVEPVWCKRLHEPINGWSWVYCENISALLRDIIRAVRQGFEPLIASVQGPINILRIEELEGLSNPVVKGCFKTHIMPGKHLELFKLASSVKVKTHPLIVVACFEDINVAELILHGIIPLVWDRLESNT